VFHVGEDGGRVKEKCLLESGTGRHELQMQALIRKKYGREGIWPVNGYESSKEKRNQEGGTAEPTFYDDRGNTCPLEGEASLGSKKIFAIIRIKRSSRCSRGHSKAQSQ